MDVDGYYLLHREQPCLPTIHPFQKNDPNKRYGLRHVFETFHYLSPKLFIPTTAWWV